MHEHTNSAPAGSDGAYSDGTAALLEQYRSIFEALSDGLIINDLETGAVVEVNPAFCRMHGYSREELIGARPTMFVHSDSHHLFRAYLDTVKAGGVFHAQATDLTKDGTPFAVEVRGRLFEYRGERRILGVVRDISERAQAFELLEARVAARTRELSALLEVSATLASTLELRPLLRLILEALAAVVPYLASAVFILEGEDTLRLLDYSGPLSAEAIARRWPLAEARHSAEVIRTGRPLIIPDVHADTPAARAFRETAVDQLGAVPPDIACWMGVPLVRRDRVIGMVAFDHGERGFFSAHHAELAQAAASQAAAAIENARLYAQAQHAAAQEERQRLARELHDSVTQALYGVTLYAEAAARHLASGGAQTAAGYLRELQQTAQEAMQEMRLLIFELRPPVLEEQGLAAALLARVGSVEGRTAGLAVATDIDPAIRLPAAQEEALYRIAQEALNNVFKHARASDVAVALRRDEGGVVLEVADNGAGFDPQASPGGGFGLRGMGERAARAGARLDVVSSPGEGTTVRVVVPT